MVFPYQVNGHNIVKRHSFQVAVSGAVVFAHEFYLVYFCPLHAVERESRMLAGIGMIMSYIYFNSFLTALPVSLRNGKYEGKPSSAK